MLLRAQCEGIDAVVLWDTGAEANFISWSYVEKHRLQSKLKPSEHLVKYADGSTKPARGEATLPLRLLTRGIPYDCHVRFLVADLQPRFDLILGIPFCQEHQPRPDWPRMTMRLRDRTMKGKAAWRRCLTVDTTTGAAGAAGSASATPAKAWRSGPATVTGVAWPGLEQPGEAIWAMASTSAVARADVALAVGITHGQVDRVLVDPAAGG